MTGNIWNSTTQAISAFYDNYTPASGEWVHAAIGWDGTYITCYINGIPNTVTLYSGPRTSPGLSGCGPLFVGGSDHNNLECKLALLRGWDQYNPLSSVGHQFITFIPERFPFRYALYNGTLMPCDFFCDYTAPAGTTCLDTSPAGCNSGPAWRTLHHGTPGNDYGNAGAVAEQPLSSVVGSGVPGYDPPWMSNPLPSWVLDSVCPLNIALGSSPAPTGSVLTPRSVPSGARIYDSFQRANQTFAFQTNPSLGNTEGGSLGPLAWNQGGFSTAAAPNQCFWGILAGQALPLGMGFLVAWVNTGSATQDLRITRSTFYQGTPGAQAFACNPGATGLAFRVQDASDYWAFVWQPSADSVGPNGSGSWVLDSVVSGTVTVVATGSVTLGADASLRVTASGSTITCYHGTDGVPGAWTQLAQVTNSTLSSATGAGITTTWSPTTYLNSLARYQNFTCF